MIIKNAEIFNENFETVKQDIEITDKIITSIGNNLSGENTFDYSGCIVLPGFIDIHTHGCMGYDVTDGRRESVLKMSEQLAKNGVTSFCPTTMTISKEALAESFGFVADAKGKETGAYIHGINMEGPFISPQKKGAQSEEYILNPDINMFRQLNNICNVSVVDIAPESDGSDEFITEVKSICPVSAAHTTSGYSQAKKAFDLGINHVTHLFNAMTPMLSRSPGLVGAVFDDKRIYAEIICDGIHIEPPVLRTAFSVLGEDRTIVISDSMAAAGMNDGEYSLGGQKVFVKNSRATLFDGTVAGSTTNMFAEFKNLISFGIPVRQAVKSCTINPAKSIKVDNITGSISIGKNADLLILDKEMNSIQAVIIKGKILI